MLWPARSVVLVAVRPFMYLPATNGRCLSSGLPIGTFPRCTCKLPKNMIRSRYRRSLRAAVGASAAPYGFTLSTWTTGAVLTHSRGVPDAFEALLFLAGAVLGFAVVGGIAFGGVTKRLEREAEEPRPLWTSLHFPSVALAIGAASLVAWALRGDSAWIVGSFCATVAYLLTLAAEGIASREK